MKLGQATVFPPTGNLIILAAPATKLVFKNCAPVTTCITKTDGTTINNLGDSDLAVHLFDILEHSSNFSDTTGSLWFDSKDEATNFYFNFNVEKLTVLNPSGIKSN